MCTQVFLFFNKIDQFVYRFQEEFTCAHVGSSPDKGSNLEKKNFFDLFKSAILDEANIFRIEILGFFEVKTCKFKQEK